MRRRIPSLEALVAFEAAARHQSFTRAAVALSLTQSAVCKQIAALEDYLGLALFHRVKKRISLTEAGELYARQIGEDLDRLERHTGALMTHRGEGNVLELASVPTFATRWLIPRLGAFKARHPGITLNLTTRSQPFIFTDTGFDAAIHFGSPEWPGASTSALFGEEMIPVCSPQLLPPAGCASAADLARLPLLHHSGRHDAWPRWFEHAGVRDVEVSAGARAAWSAWRRASWASRKNASPASVGTAPLAVRCSSRVLSSLSSRLICWLRADCTMSRSSAARPMDPSSTMRTK